MRVLDAAIAAIALAPLAMPQERVSFPTEDGGSVYADVYGTGDGGVALLVGACQFATTAPSAPPPDLAPPDPVVEAGPISAGAEAQAAQLFARAEEAFRADRLLEARQLTADIVARYPTAPVSGRALLLNARAARDAGDASAADTAAQRYLELLPSDDPRIASLRLLQAEAFTDDAPARVDRLMRIPVGAPPSDVARAAVLARGAADLLVPEELEAARSNAPSDATPSWGLDVRAATAALEAGYERVARRVAPRDLCSWAPGLRAASAASSAA